MAMFWADELAQEIIGNRKQDDYLITDTKTPSGKIHVGALEGVLYHATIAKALQKKGKKANFQYGFDDFDPMDSLPIYVPKEFKKYLGVSLSEIPAPVGKGSYADYFADEFIHIFNTLGENPIIVYTSKMYRNGQFNEAIKIALDKAEIIKNIYQKIAGQVRPMDWFPIQMVCEKCGKIGTTRAYQWDGEAVSYSCDPNWVKYTQGCGYQSKRSPLNGNSKLPWKVEWAAKWFVWGSDVEGAGKDHMTKNGSHDMAKEIAKQVYSRDAPVSFRYEFFLVGGKKMSSSKGLGNSAKEVSQALPPELLRFLIIKSNPNSQINFTLNGPTIIQLFNDFDQAHRQYLEKSNKDNTIIYSYSLVEKETPEYLMRFSKIVSLVQISYLDINVEAKKEKGAELTATDIKELNKRIKYAIIYLQHFATEAEKFAIQQELPNVTLNDREKELLKIIAEFMASVNEPEKLHNFIYTTGKGLGLTPKETFETIYNIFLNKTSGPKVGWFLCSLDKGFVVKRLQEASK